jgi:predicted RNase H-like HicB family nuclease
VYSTIRRRLKELASPPQVGPRRIRRPGGGRKKTLAKDPTLLTDLEGLVEPTASGHPESPLRWTSKSVNRRPYRRGRNQAAVVLGELVRPIGAPRVDDESGQPVVTRESVADKAEARWLKVKYGVSWKTRRVMESSSTVTTNITEKGLREEATVREFMVIIEQDEEGCLAGSVPEFRVCHTQAYSLDELITRADEAILLCLEMEVWAAGGLK